MRNKAASLVALVALALLSFAPCDFAHAQGTPRSKTQMSTEILQQFPDNSVGGITPQILRNVTTDMVASSQQYAGVNAQVGTTYTVQGSDYGQVLTFSSGSPVAVTLGSGATLNPFSFYVTNLGAGTVTITPSIGTINGAANLALTLNQGVFIVSDGTNWQVFKGFGVGTLNSVALTATSTCLTVGGSPITGSSGTITLTSAGTSGGIPYFNSATTCASSGALGANQIVLGGGAGTAPSTPVGLGTTTTLLHGNAAGAPSFAAVNLAGGADVTGPLPIANGGTSQITAPLARTSSGLNIDEVTTFGDANKSVAATDRTIATSANFTAQRTVTLPAVSAMNAGQQLVVIDSFGAINGSNTMVIAAGGGDTINGVASITVTLQFGGAVLWPTTANKWGFIAATAGGGAGTVTSVVCGNGLAGGTISTTGTCTLAGIVPQGRATLASGTPVMTASQAAKSTIFYDCYAGTLVPVYNGTSTPGLVIPSCEYSMGLDAVTPHVASGSAYDIFGVNNSGSLVTCVGPAWSAPGPSVPNRGSGAGTTQIHFNTSVGFYTNQNALTHCWGGASGTTDFGSIAADQATYLASFLASANGQTTYVFGAASSGGTAAQLYLFNAYNRVSTGTTVTDSGATYAYTTATVRQARASAGNQVSFFLGLSEDAVSYSYTSGYSMLTAISARTKGGVGFDVTNAFSKEPFYCRNPQGANFFECAGSTAGQWMPGIGVHILAAVETGDGTNANVFDLDSNATLDAIIRN